MNSTTDEALVPAAITDPGMERELNEDRYAVIESNVGVAWFVCDGVGGVAGGELAAQLAIDAMRRELEQSDESDAEKVLVSALQEANRVIVLRRQNQAFAQMGTTVVSALFAGNQVVLGHVGDSRAYLVRNGEIQQLTTDHTLVQELVDRGQLNAEAALSHPEAHVLTRCIGAEPGVKVSTSKFWLWPDEISDILVLCSDGLYTLVNEREIAEFTSTLSPQKACVKLVELAKSRGGYDNITIAVIPLEGTLRERPSETVKKRASHKKSAPSLMWMAGLGILSFVAVTMVMLYLLGE
jgi:protein phosphatase